MEYTTYRQLFRRPYLQAPLQRHRRGIDRRKAASGAQWHGQNYPTAVGRCSNTTSLAALGWRYFDRRNTTKLYIDATSCASNTHFRLPPPSTATTTVKTRPGLVPAPRYRRPRDHVTWRDRRRPWRWLHWLAAKRWATSANTAQCCYGNAAMCSAQCHPCAADSACQQRRAIGARVHTTKAQ